MSSLTRLVIDLVVIATVFGLIFYIYQTYGSVIIDRIYGEQKVSVTVKDVPVVAFIADTDEERGRGLSNVRNLPEGEGMLFIFDSEGHHRFWMKDTFIPLDIIWINNNLEIVHIERNVKPETYPASFGPTQPARFVLETNAFFVSTFNISVGDRVAIPANRLPDDLQ